MLEQAVAPVADEVVPTETVEQVTPVMDEVIPSEAVEHVRRPRRKSFRLRRSKRSRRNTQRSPRCRRVLRSSTSGCYAIETYCRCSGSYSGMAHGSGMDPWDDLRRGCSNPRPTAALVQWINLAERASV